MSGVIMFILGGLVASIIFYPTKKQRQRELILTSRILAWQYFVGVRVGQTQNVELVEEHQLTIYTDILSKSLNMIALAEKHLETVRNHHAK